MTAPSEQSAKTGSFPLFDWLRFALASAVALSHGGLIAWGNAGNFAVQVFFALSGWLIGGILLRTRFENLPSFYYNRGTRIWIPYALAVAAIYLLAALRDPVTSDYFKFLFYDSTFTHNWFIPKIPSVIEKMPLHGTGSHFWSISVEEQFYLAAPLLIVLLPFGRSMLFWAIVALVATISRSWYGAISIGVLASVVRFHLGDWQLTRSGFIATALVGVVAAVVTIAAPQSYSWSAPVLAATIVLMTSWPGDRGNAGQFAGGMSYPLYLYHWTGTFLVGFASHFVHLPAVLASVAAYAVALVVGSVAYVIVDQNIMKWRSRLFRPVFGRILMICAYSLLAAGILGGLVLKLGT